MVPPIGDMSIQIDFVDISLPSCRRHRHASPAAASTWPFGPQRLRANRSPRVYSRELIDVIFEQPYCRIAHVVSAGIEKRQTASEYLARLAEIGVLEPVQSARDKLFIHRALLALLASETHEIVQYRRA